MFKRSLHRLGNLLVNLAMSDDAPPAQAAHARGKTAKSHEAFDQQARQLLAGRQDTSSSVPAGTIQLVGLNDIRRDLGADWERVADKAQAIAEAAIRHHLGKTDLYNRHDNETYVLCFPTLSKSEAERKAKRIVKEIRSTLARDLAEAKNVGVQEFVAEVDYGHGLEDGQSLADVLVQSLHTIRQQAETAYQRQRKALLKDAEVFYQPVWQPAKKFVAVYRSVLDERTGTSSLDYLQSLSSPEEMQHAIADLDYLIFSRTIGDLHALVQDSGKAWFLIPVHFQTVNAKASRDEYLKLCEAIPAAYRNFVMLEIYGIPEGTPTGRLLDFTALLRGCCKALVFELSLDEDRSGELDINGVFAISTDVSGFRANPAAMVQQLSRHIELVQGRKLATIAHGADTLGLVDAAIKAGFGYVSGQAVAATVEKPKSAHRLNPTPSLDG